MQEATYVRQRPDDAPPHHNYAGKLDYLGRAGDAGEQHPPSPGRNPGGALIGLITRTTLEQVLPSKLTTLSVYELHYQLDKINVRQAMLRQVITVAENVPIEQAARMMWEKKIGCLPVMRGNTLVGIVTDIDLMRTMFDLLGARQPGVRMTLKVPGTPGELAKITGAIAAENGDITAFGVLPTVSPWSGGCWRRSAS